MSRSERAPLPLEPSGDVIAGLGADVLAYADRFLGERTSAAASSAGHDPGLIEDLLAMPPAHGADLDDVLRRLDQAIATGFDTASGRFLSYVPSGALYTSALGTFLGAVTNRYSGAPHASPGAVAIEQSVIDWFISLYGLPAGAAGVLLSGGSVANLTATVAARSRLGEHFDHGVVYTSERAHHSVTKAARIAGIRRDRIRPIRADSELRLDPVALRDAIEEDRASGLRPMMIVATAGTTDTGTVDPLHECALIARAAGAWFHVDAAYGGFFQLTDRGRALLEGIELADSITIDPHKSLFLPWGIGALLVRDEQALTESHEGRGSYMQDVPDSNELPHYFALGPELTRPFRGLAVWLPLQLHGVAVFRDELDRMLDLARDAADVLGRIPGVELTAPPDLSIVTFRASAGDAASQHILDFLNDSREVHVSSTTVQDRFVVRMAFLSQRTTDGIAQRAVALVREALDAWSVR